MAKIQRTNPGRLFFPSVKSRTRALMLGTLGLIPAACQSPVARFIPARTIRELQDPAPSPAPNKEAVAREITDKTGKKSLAATVIKSWGLGLGQSGISIACFPAFVSMDIALSSIYGKHRGKIPSFIFKGVSNIVTNKIPSYTSGLVDNSETKMVRAENKKIEEEEK